jgi:hypothetical protein
MSNVQKSLLVTYLPLTFVILIFDHIYPNENVVLYLKYTTMITLFLSSMIIKKKFHDQKIMALSFIFLVIADFFLVFFYTFNNFKIDLSPLGVAGFLFAYICLIIAYQKNFKIGKGEIMAGIPMASIFLYVFFSLKPYVYGFMFIGSLIFFMVLCYMTWTGICTLFRNYFTWKISKLIAVSSILMFICDIGVAFSFFHPTYSKEFIPWLQNIIWAAYIPGWTLLAVIINEDALIIIPPKYKL